MTRERTAHAYELELRRLIKERTGKECERWLLPQIRSAASNMQMLRKVHDELLSGPLTSLTIGSTGQQKNEVNPLLPYYDKLNRTLLAQFEALGLNYNTTPKKVTENTKQGGREQDALATLLSDVKGY